jgi:ribonuclease Y
MEQIQNIIAMTAASGLLGILVGYLLHFVTASRRNSSASRDAENIRLSAQKDAQKIITDASAMAERSIQDIRESEREHAKKIQKSEEYLHLRETSLSQRDDKIDEDRRKLESQAGELRTIKESLISQKDQIAIELEKVCGLTQEDAKEKLFAKVESDVADDLNSRMIKLERDAFERLDKKAKDILAISIQRIATSSVSEVMTSHITIPNDDVKGKIIGKEGRNIRAFERAAGVELLVDESPNSITISAFDPVRRQVARLALENLIIDGRVQPARIEEIVEKAKNDINCIIKSKGEQATAECGLLNIDPRLTTIIGRLFFRTSYGQNVLQHSIEMSHIAGYLAAELGADVQIAKAGALLHDIGKAVDHEVQGTHVEIGRRILKKFNVDERIILAMQAHHEEYPYETLESIIVQIADTISGGRPGARRESVEQYIKKLEELERLATSHEGVDKAYALSAGREIRVFVQPEKIDDITAIKLARDIAHDIEKELKYPGEIKVCVIREKRCIEYAH